MNIDPSLALALEVDIACDLHLRLLEAKQQEKFEHEMESMKQRHR